MRGRHGDDPTEPPASDRPIPFRRSPTSPPSPRRARGCSAWACIPSRLPLGRRHRALGRPRPHALGRLSRYRCGQVRRRDGAARSGARVSQRPLVTGAQVRRLIAAAGGGRIAGVEYESAARRAGVAAGMVVLSAGAVNSAILLLASADDATSRTASPTAPTGRPQFHEPQLLGDAGHRSAAHQ